LLVSRATEGMGPNNHHNEQDDSERKKRIDDLKRQADELAGGEMTSWKSEDLSPDIEEAFLQGVIAYEVLRGRLIFSNSERQASIFGMKRERSGEAYALVSNPSLG